VILAAATTAMVALKEATSTLPIVFAQVTDPVGLGLIRNLASPGGNITGFASYEVGIAAKWVELLKQIAPGVTRVAAIHDRAFPTAPGVLREIEAGVSSFGLSMSTFAVGDRSEIERAINGFA